MSILDTLQAKVDAIDSDSTMSEILSLLHSVKDHPHKSVYDSAGLMPTDSAYLGSIAYSDYRDTMYVFTNIDSGWKLLDSDVATSIPPNSVAQGSNFGYAAGGRYDALNIIDKYPFAADANATDVGDLLYGVVQNTGVSSKDYGYSEGGNSPTIPTNPPAYTDIIQKWPTAADANATDVADLLGIFGYSGSTFSETHGYVVGNSPNSNVIQKHEFSTDGDATDVGDLLNAQHGSTGNSCSTTHGYVAGGTNPAFPTTYTNTIQKFPFAVDENSTDVGDLLVGAQFASGAQSTTHGYHCGGQEAVGFGYQNVIEKYSHSTDENSSDVGDMLATGYFAFGASSTTHGYVAGQTPPSSNVTIQKFSFSADENATDVGDLTTGRYNAASAHH